MRTSEAGLSLQVCKDLDEKSENLNKQVEKGGVKVICKEIIYGAKI
jgi:hypothetical protein